MVPEDLIPGILWRLPVRSLLRFSCVSKSWHSTISDPQFLKSHRRIQSQNNCQLLLFNNRTERRSESGLIQKLKLKHPDLSNYFSYHIVSICDGLIALKFFDRTTRNKTPNYSIVICNPCTGESRQLPTFELGSGVSSDDSDSWDVRFGFGYDSSNDDYKVVVLVHHKKYLGLDARSSSNTTSMGVLFSLKCHTNWRLVKELKYDGQLTFLVYEDNSGVYLNGALHWATYVTTKTGQKFNIVVFNLANDTFFQLPGLDIELERDLCFHNISIYKGCICVYKYCRPRIRVSGEYICLWIMKEYGNPFSWTCISFNICSLHVPRNLYVPYIPSFQSEFRVWFSRDNSNLGSKLDSVLYDLQGRQVANLQISKDLKLDTFLFHETFVSPFPDRRPIDQAGCAYLEDFFSICDAYTGFIS